jgi:hypothetical protein
MIMKYHKQVLSLLLLFASLVSNAQSDIDKAVRLAEKTAKIIEKLGNIFRKKNKDTTIRVKAIADKKAVDSQGSPIMNFAGKLASNVKYIDCDRMFPFNLGAAIVIKGNAFGLIDASGDFLVPFINTRIYLVCQTKLVTRGFLGR